MSLASAPSRAVLEQPWKHVSCLSGDFLIKYCVDGAGYEAYFCRDTDMNCIWAEVLNNDGISDRLKDLNPSVEAPAIEIMKHISATLLDGQATDVNYELAPSATRSEATLSMNVKLGGGSEFPKVHLKWLVKGRRTSEETVNLLVTVPLLKIIATMNVEVDALQRIIAKKDIEILDYKAQGGKVTRKHLETKPFDTLEFNKETRERVLGLRQPVTSTVFTAAHVRDIYMESTHGLMHHGSHSAEPECSSTSNIGKTTTSAGGHVSATEKQDLAADSGGQAPKAELVEEQRRREELHMLRRSQATGSRSTAAAVADSDQPKKKIKSRKGLL